MRKIKEALKLIVFRPYLIIDFDYDKYWRNKRGSKMQNLTEFQKTRADCVIKMIEAEGKVLDLGSGDGSVISYIEKNTKLDITASDFSEVSLEHLNFTRQLVLKIDVENLQTIELQQYNFKYVFAFEVLEHVKGSEQLLMNLLQIGDEVVFSVPNTGYFAHRLRLLFGKFPLQWRLSPSEHLRFWTLSDMRWWLNSLGYHDAQIETYEGLALLNRIFPSIFSMGIIVKVKK